MLQLPLISFYKFYYQIQIYNIKYMFGLRVNIIDFNKIEFSIIIYIWIHLCICKCELNNIFQCKITFKFNRGVIGLIWTGF